MPAGQHMLKIRTIFKKKQTIISTLLYKHKQRWKSQPLPPWQVSTVLFLSIKCTLWTSERQNRGRVCVCVCFQSFSQSNMTASGVWRRWGSVAEWRCVFVELTLINVALAVGVRLAVGPLLHVGHVLVKVRQRHRVLLVDLPLHVRLQHRPLVVGERHGEQSFGVAHELVDVSLPGHLPKDKRGFIDFIFV